MSNKNEQNRRRRGPKNKAPEDLRQYCLSVRLSPEEMDIIDQRRGPLLRPAYLRAVALQRRLPPQIPQLNLEAWRELSRAASNLHHIALLANIGVAQEARRIRDLLADFRARLIGADLVTAAEMEPENEEK